MNQGHPLNSSSSSSAPRSSQSTLDGFFSGSTESGTLLHSTSKKRSLEERAPSEDYYHTSSFSRSNRGVAANIGMKKSTSSRNPSFGPVNKKLVIRSFKVKPTLPENFEQLNWEMLNAAVQAVQKERPVPHSLESLYTSCENMCHHQKQSFLYQRLVAACQSHADDSLTNLKGSLTSPEVTLKLVDQLWTNHCRQMIMIRSIFLYLDRTYVIHQSSSSSTTRSIWDKGLEIFRDTILGDDFVKSKLVDSLLVHIRKERTGDTVPTDLLRSVLKMLQDLSIYISTFETAFLESTANFYKEESARRMTDIEISEAGSVGLISSYLNYVAQQLKIETSKCDYESGYLAVGTRRPLTSTLDAELIKPHAALILEKGFNKLVSNQRLQDLAQFYQLLERVGYLDTLRQYFSRYIEAHGLTLVSDPSRDPEMVTGLLEFKAQTDNVLKDAFQSSESFLQTRNESFEHFINKRPNKPAELIAKHVDQVLRSSKLTEDQVENSLNQCMALFRYVSGKDVFEAFYSKDLAKRLLLGKSASVDAEKSMLSKLKAECGAGFTTKLEGMFKDMDISKDIMASFKESARLVEQVGSIDLHVNVLTSGIWPTYFNTIVNINLTPELARCQEVFKEFYLSKHNGRKLIWQNQMGHSVLRVRFDKGNKELFVSTAQAIVLLQFNECDREFTFSELLTNTGMDTKELARVLQSLSCGKPQTRILNKNPKGKEVASTDTFSFHAGFENPLFRIKIPNILAGGSGKEKEKENEEDKATNEKVFQDRQYQIDAAIVRIMKTRKSCTHNVLRAELFEILKFPIPGPDLKKRIESLIERDYMERDQNDSSTYLYLA